VYKLRIRVISAQPAISAKTPLLFHNPTACIPYPARANCGNNFDAVGNITFSDPFSGGSNYKNARQGLSL
jgi:hypothetical protein